MNVPVVTSMDTVTPSKMEFLWKGRFPLGTLSMLVGPPGVGKSKLARYIAARVSVGGSWPDGSPCAQGHAILLGDEDGLGDVVAPELLGFSADRAYVKHLAMSDGEDATAFSLQHDLKHLDKLIGDTGARFFALDPVSDFTDGTPLGKEEHVRPLLKKLAKLAGHHKAAALGLLHLNKDEEKAAINRILGAAGFTGVARAVYLVEYHPADLQLPMVQRRRVLATVKVNGFPAPESLSFLLMPTGQYKWESCPDIPDADALLTGKRGFYEQAVKAKDDDPDVDVFLRDLLNPLPMEAKKVFSKGLEAGFTRSQLNTAKQRLKIKSEKVTGQKDGGWVWKLPPWELGHLEEKI